MTNVVMFIKIFFVIFFLNCCQSVRINVIIYEKNKQLFVKEKESEVY